MNDIISNQKIINSFCAELNEYINQLPKFDDYNTKLPENGLYLHFETEENATHNEIEEKRIVRVGGHPTQGGLSNRFKRHYTGSKKTSVFLRYVGGALIRQNNPDYSCIKGTEGDGHWEKQKGKYCPLCTPIKKASKDYIINQTSFTFIKVNDAKLRDQLEKAITATISLCDQCVPSNAWLGYFCYNDKVKKSGLWQDDYVLNTDYLFNNDLFDQLKCQIDETLGWIEDNLPK